MSNKNRSKQAPQDPPDTPQIASPEYDPLSAPDGLSPHGLVFHDASLRGDAHSFPVLKAFQDYLEKERQQARKRLVTLTIFFVSLMTLVVAGFIIAFIVLLGSVAKREDNQQTRQARQDRLIEEILLQQRKASETASVTPTDLLARQMTRELQSTAQNLQTNLGSQLAAVGSATTRLDSKLEEQNAEMAKLRDALAAMQQENASLRADLPKLAIEAARKAAPPPVASVKPLPVASSVKPLPVASAAPPPVASAARSAGTTAPATTNAVTAPVAAGNTSTEHDETVLQIRSRNGEQTIPWHTFVPQ